MASYGGKHTTFLTMEGEQQSWNLGQEHLQSEEVLRVRWETTNALMSPRPSSTAWQEALTLELLFIPHPHLHAMKTETLM